MNLNNVDWFLDLKELFVKGKTKIRIKIYCIELMIEF